MRVLFLHEDQREAGKGGGAESLLRDTREALHRLGHETAWCYGQSSIVQAIQTFRPDVCHVMTVHNWIGFEPVKWLQQNGFPHIWALMDYWPFCGGRMLLTQGDKSCAAVTGVCDHNCTGRWAPKSYQQSVSGSPVIALNRYTAEIYERNGIGVAGVVPLGIDTEFFRPDQSKRNGTQIITTSAWPQWPTKGMHVLKAALRKTRVGAKLVTGASRERVRDELQKASIFVFPSCYQETWGLCVLPGQHIYTTTGPVTIETIRPGDQVLTHSGRYMPVTVAPMPRAINEAITAIYVVGMNQPIRLTGEHPVYAISAEGRGLHSMRGLVCRGARPQWIAARNLRRADLLVMPRCAWASERASMDVSIYSTIPRNGSILESRFSDSMAPALVTYRDVVQQSDYSYTTVSAVLGHYNGYPVSEPTRMHVEAVAHQLGWRPKKLSIPADWPLDFETGWLVGYYAAEGSISPSYHVEWSCHAKEEDYRARVLRILVRWGLRPHAERLSGQRARVRVCSKALAQVLEGLCGCGAANKHLPMVYALTSTNFAKGLVAGAWAGDGHIGAGKQAWTYCTISTRLAHDMRQLLASVGIMGSLLSKQRRYSVEVSGNQRGLLANILDVPFVKTARRSGQNFIADEHYFYVPIRRIASEPYEGVVYNMETAEDHSYCVDGIIVHNCLTEAMACGCACISSDVAGPRAQIEDGVTGLLVPPRDSDRLAAAIRWLLDHPKEQEEMGQRARAWAASKATLDAMGGRWVATYRRVLNASS